MLKILMVFSFQILFFELFGFLSSYSCVWSSADIFLVRLKLLVVYIREEGFQFFGRIFLAEHLQATASVNFSCTSNAIAFFFLFFSFYIMLVFLKNGHDNLNKTLLKLYVFRKICTQDVRINNFLMR